MKKLPSCPVCRTAKQVSAVGVVGDTFRCGRCGGLFDNDPDEGGSHYSDPTKRIEKQESRLGYRTR